MKLRILATAAAFAAAIALPGTGSAAPPRFHTLDVVLPGGDVAHLRYAGDIPPSLIVAPEMAADADAASPFAMFDRVATLMAAENAAMLQEAVAMSTALEGALADGGTGLVQVAEMPGACVEATRVVMRAGAAPQVTAFRSAGCGAPARPAAGPATRPPAAPSSSRLIEARLDSAGAPAIVR